jgi:stearoyl-CoA desaturase (delta-9 desaturase)
MLHSDPRWRSLPKFERYEEYIKDIASDPYYRWLDRYDYMPYLILLFTLYLAGGWAWVFWGGFISTVGSHHITWSVNSVSHKFGYRSFNTNDTSTNNWLIGLLALGEGWHNNHHAFPSSPKQGFFKWWEFDFTYLVILFLQKLGLVHNLRYANEKQIKRAQEAATVHPALTVENEGRLE